MIKPKLAACTLAAMLSVGAVACAPRCVSVNGLNLSETFSFELLRPMTPAERAADASMTIDRIQVFEDKNEHWDMDAACRFGSLPLRAEFRDAGAIARFIDAVRDDVVAPTGGLSECRPRDTLPRLLYRHEPSEVGYLLVRPCAFEGQPEEGMMSSYRADGDVSLRSGARTLEAIKAR